MKGLVLVGVALLFLMIVGLPGYAFLLAQGSVGPVIDSSVRLAMAGLVLNAGLLLVTGVYLLATVAIAWTSIQSVKHAESSAHNAEESAKTAQAALEQMQIQGEAAVENAAAARASVKEMQAQRRMAARPIVIFEGGGEPPSARTSPWDFILRVRNVGQGPALNIQVTVQHDEDPSVLTRYGWGLVTSLITGEKSLVFVSQVTPEQGVAEIAVPQGYKRIWVRARAEYIDPEGNVHLTQCRVLLGPPDVLPDGKTTRAGSFPVSVEPGTHVFGTIEQLTEMR